MYAFLRRWLNVAQTSHARPQRKLSRPLLELERLEERLNPTQGDAPQAIFYTGPGGAAIPLAPTDIGAAFAGILAASGRKNVVVTQRRHGGLDATDKGATIDAVFTPTGLFTLQDSIRLPVTVLQFAKYFGFDHLNWMQQVTIPPAWVADEYPAPPLSSSVARPFHLEKTFLDPQPYLVKLRTLSAKNATIISANIPARGDGSGLYYNESPAEWRLRFVNPLLLADPLPPSDPLYFPKEKNTFPPEIIYLPTNPYWFAFEDTPEFIYEPGDPPLSFTTTLVGVKANGDVVSLNSPYGTQFSWKSDTNFNRPTETGIIFLNQAVDSPSRPMAISGGISDIQYTNAGGPVVTVNPLDQVAGSANSVSFTAAAIGNPPPTAQWQVSTDGGNTYNNVAGATSPTLTFSTTATQNDNAYRAVFSNSSGSATSTAATLMIATAPIVTLNPTSQTVGAGNTLSLTAAAAGTPVPSVQWQLSTDAGKTFNNIAGATATTFTMSVTADQNNAQYRAVFTNASGSAVTNTAFATVNSTPSNLVIDATAGVFPQFHLIDPGLGGGNFGAQIVTLTTGNVVVTDAGGPQGAGVVYLFNGQTGALISALTGTGDGPFVTPLANGNFVVVSSVPSLTGAVTWGSGTTGVSGVVSSANSLVGINQGGVGSVLVTPLTNGNYVVANFDWHNTQGIVVWRSGTTATSGTVSTASGLVGNPSDYLGNGGVTALANGNYVVDSTAWNGNAGAVTWANGDVGLTGIVSAANSLVGDSSYDSVGISGVLALSNGNYVVATNSWHGSTGAVTWGNGATGTNGTVSAANSLVGNATSEGVGTLVVPLSNGNYVVDSNHWSASPGDLVGAVTWANGSTGLHGIVSVGNSLVGSTANDAIGGIPNSSKPGVVALTDGNYVVVSPDWNNSAGAVTWGNGATGLIGTVSAGNSLVGANPYSYPSNAGDKVGLGGVTALANGNYVVDSSAWRGNNGAVTWGNGKTGSSGVVSPSNSLVGSNSSDLVGSVGVTALANGNYVVASPDWGFNAGAATWGNGNGGTTGAVSAGNSLVGNNPSPDRVGKNGVTALTNGNYVVDSPDWGFNAGAATWGNGNGGTTGAVSADNSLVGNNLSSDRVGQYGVTALTNGNYVVLSPYWNNATGAATWGNGSSVTKGIVSAANSLTDFPGLNFLRGVLFIATLPNGNYFVVNSPGSASGGSAATWGDGNTGATLDGQGKPDAQNSLRGGGGEIHIEPISSGDSFFFTSAGDNSIPVGLTNPNLLAYPLGAGQTVTITPGFLTRSLNAGIDVTIQANNDIILNSPLTLTPQATAGSLTLQAGRSILLNASLNLAGGDLTLTANDTQADGVVNGERDLGNSVIAQQANTSITAGAVTVDLKNSSDKTNNGRGSTTLPNVNASSQTVLTPDLPFNFDKLGAYRPSDGSWSLDSDGKLKYDPAISQVFRHFSTTGVTPVSGDWNKTGRAAIGDFSNGTWHLDLNDNGVVDTNETFTFGQAGDQPVAGDWTGDGVTKLGVFRAAPDGITGEFILDVANHKTMDGSNLVFTFGLKTDRIIVGDWSGDKKAKVGVFRDATAYGSPGGAVFTLDTNNNHGYDAGVDSVFIFGLIKDGLVIGDWNGDGRSKVGVYRDGSAGYNAAGTALFSLDTNGNLAYDAGVDSVFLYGLTSDKFVTGNWNPTPPLLPAQFAAGGQGPGGVSSLTEAQLVAVLNQALTDWEAHGANAAQLAVVPVHIGHLDNALIGWTDATGITLDASAAGWGWSTDLSGPAAGKMDLLTVVEHELGHELGLSDLDPAIHPNDLMASTLPTGTRRTIARIGGALQ